MQRSLTACKIFLCRAAALPWGELCRQQLVMSFTTSCSSHAFKQEASNACALISHGGTHGNASYNCATVLAATCQQNLLWIGLKCMV
jgi:hypothetical protein